MLLSAATHEKIRTEISNYPHARGALLYALHMARDEVGALGKEVFAEVGTHFDMRAGEVAEVASFYSLFNQPKAEAAIQVCTGLPCCLNGARGLVREAEQRLGTKSGTATADGRFAIVEVECLGSCGTAPVVQVNRNPYIERVDPGLPRFDPYVAPRRDRRASANSANLANSRRRRWLSASAERPAAPDDR